MYPFRNPEGIVNREHFTAVDVKRMHAEDGDLDDVFVSSVDKEEQLDQDDAPPTERDGTDSGEQRGKDEGEQSGKNVGEQRQERGTERPRAEGEKIGGLARGGHGLKPYRWTDGRHIPSSAQLSLLTDTQLARALAHHCFSLQLPKSYWVWNSRYTQSEVTIRKAKQQKDMAVVEVDVVQSAAAREKGVWYDLPISTGK
eukprot:2750017-Rhodomonas_salina.1